MSLEKSEEISTAFKCMTRLSLQHGNVSKIINENGPNWGVTEDWRSLEILLPQREESRAKNSPWRYCSVSRPPTHLERTWKFPAVHTYTFNSYSHYPNLKVYCYVRLSLECAIYLFYEKIYVTVLRTNVVLHSKS